MVKKMSSLGILNLRKIMSAIALTLILSSCKKELFNAELSGSGNIISQTLSLNSFTEIEISNSCDVELVAGSSNKVVYSDYENIIQHLKFELVGNKLVIKTIPENISISNSKAKAKVYISDSLTALFISGSGNMSLKNSFNGINTCNISGSGNIIAEINSTSSNMNASITGSGNIDILKISSQNALSTISGSGNISMAVSHTLTGVISGSGNISYLGNPTVTKNITGSGTVIKL